MKPILTPIIVGILSGLGVFATLWTASLWIERTNATVQTIPTVALPTVALPAVALPTVALPAVALPTVALPAVTQPVSRTEDLMEVSESNDLVITELQLPTQLLSADVNRPSAEFGVQKSELSVVPGIDECPVEVVLPIQTIVNPPVSVGTQVAMDLKSNPVIEISSSPAENMDLVVSPIVLPAIIPPVVSKSTEPNPAPLLAPPSTAVEKTPAITTVMKRPVAPKFRLTVPATLPQVNFAASAAKRTLVQTVKNDTNLSAVSTPRSQSVVPSKIVVAPTSLELASESIRRLSKKLGSHAVR